MKTEFLKKFYKDLNKIALQNTKNSIADSIENIEFANNISEIKNIKNYQDTGTHTELRLVITELVFLLKRTPLNLPELLIEKTFIGYFLNNYRFTL